MARPIEYVIEVSREEYEQLVKNLLDPPPNPARDETIRRALNFPVRALR